MKIRINEKYGITSDSRQYKLCNIFWRTKDGVRTEVWEAESFYPTFEGAVKGLYRLQVLNSEATSFKQAMADAERFLGEITKALDPDYQIVKSPLRGSEAV